MFAVLLFIAARPRSHYKARCPKILFLTGTVVQLVEHPLCDREVAGLMPGRVVP